MASLAVNIAGSQATSPDISRGIIDRNIYQRDEWLILTLNDAVEDALSKILRFGFDIDRATAKPGVTKTIRDQILNWAKHIAGEIPGYTNWEEIYNSTFAALHTPDAVPGKDDTPIGTEADLVAHINDFTLERDYALQDEKTEKSYLMDHALSLGKARPPENPGP